MTGHVLAPACGRGVRRRLPMRCGCGVQRTRRCGMHLPQFRPQAWQLRRGAGHTLQRAVASACFQAGVPAGFKSGERSGAGRAGPPVWEAQGPPWRGGPSPRAPALLAGANPPPATTPTPVNRPRPGGARQQCQGKGFVPRCPCSRGSPSWSRAWARWAFRQRRSAGGRLGRHPPPQARLPASWHRAGSTDTWARPSAAP